MAWTWNERMNKIINKSELKGEAKKLSHGIGNSGY